MNDDLRRLMGEVSCASLVDAIGRIHQHRAHILDRVSPDPAQALFGPVVIVAVLPHRDDLPEAGLGFATLFYRAVADARRATGGAVCRCLA